MKIGFALICVLVSTIAAAGTATTRLNESILTEYLKIQKEFTETSCKPQTEETYQQYDKSFRGDGNFIPVLIDEKVDVKTIKNLLPLYKEKSKWIDQQIAFLKKVDDLKSIRGDLDRIEQSVSYLQDTKKDFYFASDKAKKIEIEAKAAKQFTQLLKEVEELKSRIPFLLSFKFPVNHLALRGEYEKYKAIQTKEARTRANSVYFFRKIVQDGTYNEDLSRNDSVIRSAFDTLYLSLLKDNDRSFLTDAERVDFRFILYNFDKLLSEKKETIQKRLEEWKERTDRTTSFYQDLIEGKKLKVSEDSQLRDVTSLLEEKARSLYVLKEFVLNKEARAYEFWSKRSDLFQSLYAIETILYSEVGTMDAPDALERKDVAQVVINRSENSTYNVLSDKDSITKFLSADVKTNENKWLNVLFKEGEFSFTYFYIPGNFHIYCPDMSKAGQFLRRQNVRIALNLLNKPRTNFPALRYFSRTSMFGRIEMDSLWGDYRPMPEVPGNRVKKTKKYYELFKKDNFKFFYDFTNENLKKRYLVVEMKGRTYVVDSKDPRLIYYYRNPHQFKYFTR